jgi:lipid-binding SYLF domain-containing protein
MAKLVFALSCLAVFVACAGAPKTESDKASLNASCGTAVADFRSHDPSLGKWFDEAHGYAIFPSIGKGGIGVGGAHGRGQVYRGKELIGYSTLTMATIGFQLGGQAFAELIFFEDEAALARFTSGSFEFAAQASAVAATAGAGAKADYTAGMAVFTMVEGGLMYEASIGGQKFEYVKK